MKNCLTITVFLLLALKSFAMQLPKDKQDKIYKGEINVYSCGERYSSVNYGSQELIDKHAVENFVPFIKGWVEEKGKKIPVHIPFTLYLKKRAERHEESYQTINFSWEIAADYEYGNFYGKKTKPSENYLTLQQKKHGTENESSIASATLLLDHYNACLKKEDFYPYGTPIDFLFDLKKMVSPLKNITYEANK